MHAFYAESDVPVRGASYYHTVGDHRVRCTRLSRHRDARDWPAVADLVYVGEVRTDTHEWDVDRVSPELSVTAEFLEGRRALYAERYGRHDYVGPTLDPATRLRRALEFVGPDRVDGLVVTGVGLRGLMRYSSSEFDVETHRELHVRGIAGTLFGATVYCFDPAMVDILGKKS